MGIISSIISSGVAPIEPLKVYYNRIEFNESVSYQLGDEQYWRVNGINDCNPSKTRSF
jgi:hypothetical protein